MRTLSGVLDDRIVPEVYRFKTPASPHRAAEIEGIEIDIEKLVTSLVPGVRPMPEACLQHDGSDTRQEPLIIEPAGGLMVPLSRTLLQIDVLARWGLPVVLCARTALGTINHSLLSIEALNNRNIPIHGIAFIGERQRRQRTHDRRDGQRAPPRPAAARVAAQPGHARCGVCRQLQPRGFSVMTSRAAIAPSVGWVRAKPVTQHVRSRGKSLGYALRANPTYGREVIR